MAKWVNTIVLDGMLDKLSSATELIVTSSQPANRSTAVSGALAKVSLSSGDFSKTGTTSRTLTIASKQNINVTTGGTVNHVCLVNSSDLLYVAPTQSSRAVSPGDTVSVGSWKITVSE